MYAAHLYDAVLLYATALGATLRENKLTDETKIIEAAKDGKSLFQHIIRDRKYDSKFVLFHYILIDQHLHVQHLTELLFAFLFLFCFVCLFVCGIVQALRVRQSGLTTMATLRATTQSWPSNSAMSLVRSTSTKWEPAHFIATTRWCLLADSITQTTQRRYILHNKQLDSLSLVSSRAEM